ncbi:MAG TPA: type VI secretion system tube protein TssD [Phnomibacter sp.]|nr:type VI secretion system tube protein TssD [Phnomibacter sp.]
MALKSYVEVTGLQQGKFKGGSIQKGREGWTEINAYNHEIATPYDPVSAAATGRKQHHPLTIWKDIDQSTISFFKALINQEQLTSVVLKNFSPSKLGGAGVETLTYTITLTNARIISIKSEMLNNKNPELSRYERTEEISFVYEKIDFLWNVGNKSATDSW